MQILVATLKEELTTAERLEMRYGKRLQALPRGSFIVRTVGKKRYGYLTYREGGKVRQDYLGPVNDRLIDRYRNQVKERKDLKLKLKNVREQIKILKRALHGQTTPTRR